MMNYRDNQARAMRLLPAVLIFVVISGCTGLWQAEGSEKVTPTGRKEMPPLPMPGFDDAVAEIAPTFQAAPGKPAVRRWTPGANGSVRLVGHLQKTTPGATAEFRVLVDGAPIWRRRFDANDAIPHLDAREPDAETV